ncbi:MAG: hypothetical protein ABL921_20655 [Pirellula sp.]
MVRFILPIIGVLALMNPNSWGADPTSPNRIVWKTSVRDAFISAVEESKPLVVAFLSNPGFRTASGSNPSSNQLSELDDARVHALAGQAEFVIAYYDHDLQRARDKDGDLFLRRLNITALPTISIIAPRTDILEELFRLENFCTAETVSAHLSKVFSKRLQELANESRELPPSAPEMSRKVGLERPSLEFNPYEPDVSGSVARMPTFSKVPSRLTRTLVGSTWKEKNDDGVYEWRFLENQKLTMTHLQADGTRFELRCTYQFNGNNVEITFGSERFNGKVQWIDDNTVQLNRNDGRTVNKLVRK